MIYGVASWYRITSSALVWSMKPLAQALHGAALRIVNEELITWQQAHVVPVNPSTPQAWPCVI
jgi:hypothetical protein